MNVTTPDGGGNYASKSCSGSGGYNTAKISPANSLAHGHKAGSMKIY